LFGGKYAKGDSISSTVDGPFRPQENLILAFARLQLNLA
jgi:hypothetical protein